MPPSDTWFTITPDWHWLITLYFFVGGLAAGSYFLAAMIDLFGDPSDRPLARIGYFVAFPLVVLCLLLLVADLNRPERFWHMLLQSDRLPLPMFKAWSAMSVGAWALLIFGAFTFVSLLGTLTELGMFRWKTAARLDQVVRRGRIGGVFALVGSLFGFFIAGYTGVLLSETNRPLWADTTLLGLLFVISAASTASALMILLGNRRQTVTPTSLNWLHRLDTWVMILELVVLVVLVVSLGPVAQLWLSAWGLLLLVGVVLAGILVPLVVYRDPRRLGGLSIPLASALVLLGGFVLRAVIVMSSDLV